MAARWRAAFGPLEGRRDLDARTQLVWTNAMALDGARHAPLAAAAWGALEEAAAHARRTGRRTLLALHVPLHKPPGACPGDRPELVRAANGAVLEQTLLSPETSDRIRQLLSPYLILSGHDHAGCTYAEEHTGRAIQAEWSGCTMAVDPELGVVQACLMHNVLFITVWITAILWLPVTVSFWMLERSCCRDVTKKEKGS